jgi:thiol-disulfide isomerase/thioredoxin
MKNFLLQLLLFTVICGNGYGQNSDKLVTISGKWDRGDSLEKLYLYKLADGELKEIASSTLQEDSTFHFAYKPAKSDFYFISAHPRQNMNRFAFYLKPGDRLDFTVTQESYVLNGENNSQENKAVTKWHDFVQPLEWKASYFDRVISTYEDFFPLFEEKLKELDNYPKNETNNSEFNLSFEKHKKYNLLDIAMNFIFTPRTMHPKSEDFLSYYRDMNLTTLTQTTEIMKYIPNSIDDIERIIINKLVLDSKEINNPFESIMENIPKISNDTIKGELIVKMMAHIKSYEKLLDYEKTYEKYILTKSQKNKMQDAKIALNETKDGNPAIDFKFADSNGKPVALSDFKGKLVYIDVWATWCGPCIKEIPHLKQLEEEFDSNENIVFLSVSIDVLKDYQKWKDFLVKEDLKGIQLFGGDDARKGITEPYKISGIPRFILVGKDGVLISSDAPRPSSSEIRPLLNANL